MNDPTEFIRTNTVLIPPPLVPEVKLHLATEVVPLWRLTEDELEEQGIPPPYWAFAWAGGQALARFVLDNPDVARGRIVLDLGSGSGLVGIAAMMSGAVHVLSADIDAFAIAAVALNAQANDVEVATTTDDVIGQSRDWNTIFVGDMCYERPLAERVLVWLKERVAAEVTVLIGDPGRSYFPRVGLEKLAEYEVQTTRELEDREVKKTAVWTLPT